MRRLVSVAVGALLVLSTVSTVGAEISHRTATPGKGAIIFGKSNRSGRIVGAATKIPRGKPIAWLAHFSSRARAKKLTLVIINSRGPGTHPKTVMSTKVSVVRSSRFTHGLMTAKRLKSRKISPAGYTMEYLTGNKTLASGNFTIESCSSCGGHGGGY